MVAALNREPIGDFYRRRLGRLTKSAPFVLRITRWRELTGPVLVVKERSAQQRTVAVAADSEVVRALRPAKKANLVERGHIAGEPQRRALPILKSILGRVRDEAGVPLHLER
jgi:hypothetical protein